MCESVCAFIFIFIARTSERRERERENLVEDTAFVRTGASKIFDGYIICEYLCVCIHVRVHLFHKHISAI